VWERNQQLSEAGVKPFEKLTYKTQNGNRIRFMMWNEDDGDDLSHGAYIYAGDDVDSDPMDKMPVIPREQFLGGTVLNSPREAVVEISNRFLGQSITLDMSDPRRPRRVSEVNEIEAAGDSREVWLDFEWDGLDTAGAVLTSEGDFFRPFRMLADAVHAVAAGGTIKIVPGSTAERGTLTGGKRCRLSAPIGGVRLGTRIGL
jgi:hypothetical protein